MSASPPARARLLATDLDRTLLPNGAQPESALARPLLARLVEERGLVLAYVTGRRLELVEEAMAHYDLPRPHFVLADVGSSLYRDVNGTWTPSAEWEARLDQDWGGRHGAQLATLFEHEPELTLQEPAAQGRHKLSYDAPERAQALLRRMREHLRAANLAAVVVHSVDETRGQGLIDVLPARSSKLRALEHLLELAGIARADCLFAGDSGNDLEVLTSTIPAVLVANATPELRARLRGARHPRLHLASGDLFGMNGNYAAGVLEGWVHYHPGDRELLERLHHELRGATP